MNDARRQQIALQTLEILADIYKADSTAILAANTDRTPSLVGNPPAVFASLVGRILTLAELHA